MYIIKEHHSFARHKRMSDIHTQTLIVHMYNYDTLLSWFVRLCDSVASFLYYTHIKADLNRINQFV